MTPGLPWPWRACRGGVVRCATGEVVTRCEDRRAAKSLLRDIEPWLRSLVTSAARPSSPASRITGHDESMTITVNGRAYTYSTAGVTAAELLEVLEVRDAGAGHDVVAVGDAGGLASRPYQRDASRWHRGTS